jgi:hypothetical protein
MISNEEAEMARLRGYLEGLNKRYNDLVMISKNPTYKSDLTDEIKNVLAEIKKTKSELEKIKNKI